MAARPRTLPAAIAPVLVGTAAAVEASDELRVGPFLAALAGSVLIQIGTNLANDYSDAKRGADDVDRLGPVRVTAAGLVTPRRVLVATWLAFAGALATGIYLAIVAGPVILVVGAVSILAGVLYTGGPRPYGYAGLGELFVFVFFGVVATAGAAFVQTEELTALALVASIPVGMLACALLVVNNLRDIPGDTVAGKRTLAVRLGDHPTRVLFILLVVDACALAPVVAAVAGSLLPVVAVAAVAAAVPPLRAVLKEVRGPGLIPVLGATGKVQLAFGALLTLGLVLSS